MSWKIEFVNQRAAREFEQLPLVLKAKFEHISNLIRAYGPFHVGMPYIKHVQKKIWEIRLNSHSVAGRCLYVTETGQKIIVLHSFIKKEKKTTNHALSIGQKRLKEIET